MINKQSTSRACCVIVLLIGRPPGLSRTDCENTDGRQIFLANLYHCHVFRRYKTVNSSGNSLKPASKRRLKALKRGAHCFDNLAMKSAALGTGFTPSGFLGGQRCPLPKATALAPKRQRLPTQAVADFVKEKPTSGRNGVAPVRLDADGSSLEKDIVRKANYVVGSEELEPFSAYRATALSVREHLIEAFNKTQKYWK